MDGASDKDRMRRFRRFVFRCLAELAAESRDRNMLFRHTKQNARHRRAFCFHYSRTINPAAGSASSIPKGKITWQRMRQQPGPKRQQPERPKRQQPGPKRRQPGQKLQQPERQPGLQRRERRLQ
jgi:hypothetical protein